MKASIKVSYPSTMATTKPDPCHHIGVPRRNYTWVAVIISWDSVPNSTPNPISLFFPFDDEFWATIESAHRPPALILDFVAPIGGGHIVSELCRGSADVRFRSPFSLRQVQPPCKPPPSVMRRYTTPENWMLFMSAGTMAMPTPAATQTDDRRGFEHLPYDPRAESRRRAQVHHLPVDTGAGRGRGYMMKASLSRSARDSEVGCGPRMILRHRHHQRACGTTR